MTIQDFNEALNEQGSGSCQTFAVLRQAAVREALEDPAGDAAGWELWG